MVNIMVHGKAVNNRLLAATVVEDKDDVTIADGYEFPIFHSSMINQDHVQITSADMKARNVGKLYGT